EIGLFRKSLHVAEYVLLFVLWWRAWRSTFGRARHSNARLALLGTLLYAVSDEWHQHGVGRDGNVFDVLIDVALPTLAWLRTEARRTRARLLPRRVPRSPHPS
ncbi:MAG: VanZ family protein, partial [Chloroflexi bacterium]|nr:VanZ family protein [Chloroflexota bacterium]